MDRDDTGLAFSYARMQRRQLARQEAANRREFLRQVERDRREAEEMRKLVASLEGAEEHWPTLGRGLRSEYGAPGATYPEAPNISTGEYVPSSMVDPPRPFVDLVPIQPAPARPDLTVGPGYVLTWDPRIGQYVPKKGQSPGVEPPPAQQFQVVDDPMEPEYPVPPPVVDPYGDPIEVTAENDSRDRAQMRDQLKGLIASIRNVPRNNLFGMFQQASLIQQYNDLLRSYKNRGYDPTNAWEYWNDRMYSEF